VGEKRAAHWQSARPSVGLRTHYKAACCWLRGDATTRQVPPSLRRARVSVATPLAATVAPPAVRGTPRSLLRAVPGCQAGKSCEERGLQDSGGSSSGGRAAGPLQLIEMAGASDQQAKLDELHAQYPDDPGNYSHYSFIVWGGFSFCGPRRVSCSLPVFRSVQWGASADGGLMAKLANTIGGDPTVRYTAPRLPRLVRTISRTDMPRPWSAATMQSCVTILCSERL
jgi:hypothetical protein